jgi:hypothetical protein
MVDRCRNGWYVGNKNHAVVERERWRLYVHMRRTRYVQGHARAIEYVPGAPAYGGGEVEIDLAAMRAGPRSGLDQGTARAHVLLSRICMQVTL